MSKSIIIKAAVATILPVAVAGNAFAYTTEQFTPEANKASYWGTSCVKYENFNDKTHTYTATGNVTKVIIKAGTQNTIYTDTFTNIGAANGKAISHVIVCTGDVTETPVVPETPVTPDKPVTPETPVTPVTPEKPVVDGDKEDKNQSACNPSDTNSANPKHHDDGVDCDKEEVVETPGQGGGQVSDEAVSTTKTPEVKGIATVVPTTLPTTGLGIGGILGAIGAGAAAYVLALRRK